MTTSRDKQIICLIIIFVIPFFILNSENTFINSYPYQDLWPSYFDFPSSYNCNVIPAIGGGYLMNAFADPALEFSHYPQAIFWKISEDGELEWRKQNFDEFGETFFSTLISNGTDRYYAFNDYNTLPCELYVLDTNCNVLLTHNYWLQDSIYVKINAMQLLNDGIIMAGWLYEEGIYSGPTLMKTDLEGEIIWIKDNRDWGNTYSINELKSVVNTIDNYYMACGFRDMNPGTGIIYKFNTEGDTLWTVMQEGYQYISILEYSDNIYYVFCRHFNSSNTSLLKFNSSGVLLEEYLIFTNYLWEQRYKVSLSKCNDGNILIIYNVEEGEIHKVTPDGEILWSRDNIEYDDDNLIGLGYNRLVHTPDSNIIYCMITEDIPFYPEFILIKTDDEGNVSSDDYEIGIPNCSLINYPNPFNPFTTIRYSISAVADVDISIFNIKGQHVKTLTSDTQQPGVYSVIWNGTDQSNNTVPSGLYLYKLSTKNEMKIKKMILLR